MRRGNRKNVVVVCVVVVVVVWNAIVWSPELTVDREDSDSLGPGRGNDAWASSYGGGSRASEVECVVVLLSRRSGSSKVTRLRRVCVRFVLWIFLVESELR